MSPSGIKGGFGAPARTSLAICAPGGQMDPNPPSSVRRWNGGEV